MKLIFQHLLDPWIQPYLKLGPALEVSKLWANNTLFALQPVSIGVSVTWSQENPELWLKKASGWYHTMQVSGEYEWGDQQAQNPENEKLGPSCTSPSLQTQLDSWFTVRVKERESRRKHREGVPKWRSLEIVPGHNELTNNCFSPGSQLMKLWDHPLTAVMAKSALRDDQPRQGASA